MRWFWCCYAGVLETQSSGIVTVGVLVLCLIDSGSSGCPPSLPARPHDFFDAQTMDAIRHRAICLNLATHIESVGNGHSVVFHSTVSAPFLFCVFLGSPMATCFQMKGHDGGSIQTFHLTTSTNNDTQMYSSQRVFLPISAAAADVLCICMLTNT